MKTAIVVSAIAALAACSADPEPPVERSKQEAPTAAVQQPESKRPKPTAPGEAPGVPDRSPVSDVSSSPGSAQGAAQVVQTYYALIEAGKYEEAWKLRSDGGGTTREDFATNFRNYAELHANIGAPSEVQGAAGWLYVEVPVQLYGQMRNGGPFSSAGTVTLRRSNNVPGASAEQLRWRIYTSR